MKILNTNQVRRIVKRKGVIWKEGLSEAIVFLIKYVFKEEIYAFWKEGKSYLFHLRGSHYYWCISKEYFKSVKAGSQDYL